MAYVPDEAIERFGEVGGSAFKLYAYYCRRRAKKSGLCNPSLARTAEDCGWAKSHTWRYRRELLDAKWIEINGDEIRCLVGFDSPDVDAEAVLEQESEHYQNGNGAMAEMATERYQNGNEAVTKMVTRHHQNGNAAITKTVTERYQNRDESVTKMVIPLNNNQPNEPAPSTSPEGDARAGARANSPAQTQALDEFIAAVERLTGTKISAGWQMGNRIKRQAMALRELGFSPPEAERIARVSGRSNFKLGFLAEDLAAERKKQGNGKTNSHQRPPETSEVRFQARKRI